MAIDSMLRGLALQTNDAADPGVTPELAYGFTNAAGQTWMLGRITATEQGGFGGRLVIETNTGGGAPGNTTIERLTITQSGHVGIGTATPGAPLHVAQYMTVGPFAATTGQGGLDVVGPEAELGFVRRLADGVAGQPSRRRPFCMVQPGRHGTPVDPSTRGPAHRHQPGQPRHRHRQSLRHIDRLWIDWLHERHDADAVHQPNAWEQS